MDAPEIIITNIKDNRNNLIVGPRNCGMTTALITHAVLECMTKDDHTVLFITAHGPLAEYTNHIVKCVIDELPYGLVNPLLLSNYRGSLKFANGSSFKIATNLNHIRGYRPNEVIVDNATYIDDLAEMCAALLPFIASSSSNKFTICATIDDGYYDNNFFFDLWTDSSEGKTPFKVTSI